MPDGRLADGHVLPAVARRARRKAGRGDLRRGRQPAHVAHVRGSRAVFRAVVQRHQEIVHRLRAVRALLRHVCRDILIVLRATTGQFVGRILIGIHQRLSVGHLLVRVRGHADLLEVLVQHFLHGEVRHQIRRAVDELLLHRRIRHHGRRLCDLVHALLQLHGLLHLHRTHHVQHLRHRLHHVRRDSACISDRVVDPRRLRHVLPQELHSDVHQLHRVQRAAPQVRTARRVRRDARELVFRLDAGHIRARLHLVGAARMPAQRRIQILPHAVPREERLRCAALLARAAIEDHRSLVARLLQIRLHADRRRHRARAQHVVAAAVAVAAVHHLLALRAAALLGQPRQRVKLAQYADHRLAVAVLGRECRLDSVEARLHLEAQLLQLLHVQRRGLILLQ